MTTGPRRGPRTIPEERWCWKVEEWPDPERIRWSALATNGRRRFGASGPAAHLRPASFKKYAEGYGRWVGFLAGRGWLCEREGPAERPTPERLDAYFEALRAQGVSGNTLIGRFIELRCALRLLAPERRWEWITRPHGHALELRVDRRRQPRAVHDPSELHAWGLEMMEQASTLAAPRARAVALRNGLMIALLSVLPLRRRSFLALALGRTMFREEDGGWRISLGPEEVKNHRPIDVRWPAVLVPWLERYLAEARPVLLRGAAPDALWVGSYGTALTFDGLAYAIHEASTARFGRGGAFRSHRFRHSVATAAPMLLPEQPGAAAALLNIGAGTVREHYDRSLAVSAAEEFARVMEAARAEVGPRRLSSTIPCRGDHSP